MLGLLRLIVIGFVVLSLIYAGLSLYSRRVRRGKLQRKWQEGPRLVDRDSFVRRGLRKYDGSVRRKLLLGVYVISVTVVIVIIYLTNFS